MCLVIISISGYQVFRNQETTKQKQKEPQTTIVVQKDQNNPVCTSWHLFSNRMNHLTPGAFTNISTCCMLQKQQKTNRGQYIKTNYIFNILSTTKPDRELPGIFVHRICNNVCTCTKYMIMHMYICACTYI